MRAAVTARSRTSLGDRRERPRGARTILALAAAALVAAAFAVAAQTGGASGRVQTVTRLVKLYLEREAAVSDAIRGGDEKALAGLLDDDFELRVASRAGSPVPRADFVREALRTRDGGGDIGGMAVHDYGAIAVVSFAMDGKSGTVFVVDVWRVAGDSQKLAVRYASPAGSKSFAIPGAPAPEPEIPKKY